MGFIFLSGNTIITEMYWKFQKNISYDQHALKNLFQIVIKSRDILDCKKALFQMFVGSNDTAMQWEMIWVMNQLGVVSWSVCRVFKFNCPAISRRTCSINQQARYQSHVRRTSAKFSFLFYTSISFLCVELPTTV